MRGLRTAAVVAGVMTLGLVGVVVVLTANGRSGDRAETPSAPPRQSKGQRPLVLEVTSNADTDEPGTLRRAVGTANTTDRDVEIRTKLGLGAVALGQPLVYVGGSSGDHDLTIRGRSNLDVAGSGLRSTSVGWIRLHRVSLSSGISATGSVQLVDSYVKATGTRSAAVVDVGADVVLTRSEVLGLPSARGVVAAGRVTMNASVVRGASMYTAPGDGVVAKTAVIKNSVIAAWDGAAVIAERTRLTYVTIYFTNSGVVGNDLRSFGSAILSLRQSCQVARVVSEGFNVARDSTCKLRSDGDRQAVSSDQMGLMAPSSGRGPMVTVGLSKKSVLVDAIPRSACDDHGATGVRTDQSGLPRPRGKGCDIGAIELQPTER